MYTQATAGRMKAFLNREGSPRELRLYPYLQYQMMNEQQIDPSRINEEERQILKMLKTEGHIQSDIFGLSVTREFWDYINDIMWYEYAAPND
jgi:hypothetical protein